VSDHLAGGGRDKKFHEWGQDKSEVEHLISRLTHPGDLIVDPFCGGGTVPAACKSLGRRWLATEINKNTALIARKRLGEM
jgi:site-specific DNA-methyltransferase (adenine-specific)